MHDIELKLAVLYRLESKPGTHHILKNEIALPVALAYKQCGATGMDSENLCYDGCY